MMYIDSCSLLLTPHLTAPDGKKLSGYQLDSADPCGFGDEQYLGVFRFNVSVCNWNCSMFPLDCCLRENKNLHVLMVCSDIPKPSYSQGLFSSLVVVHVL